MELCKGYSLWVILSVILVVLIASDSARATPWATSWRFTFFLHEKLVTLNPSLLVTQPLPGAPNGSYFGALAVFDDSMTTEPDPNSLEIGRGRGFYIFDAEDTAGLALQFVWTAQFNAASYGHGTTLSFAGFERATDELREISIVGGTGKFRYARGYAEITTYSIGETDAVLKIAAYFTYGL